MTASLAPSGFRMGLGLQIPNLVNEAGQRNRHPSMASYYDARPGGLSRIWAEPPASRHLRVVVGSQVGRRVEPRKILHGLINSEVHSQHETRCQQYGACFNAVRGLITKSHSANADGPYSDGGGRPGGTGGLVASTNSLSDGQKFFRVSASSLLRIAYT
jgi:hypothetical protein